jgi:hypothetical protein
MTKHAEQTAQRKPYETWAEESATPAWLLAAMRAKYRWPVGREMTSDEFQRAARETAGAPFGYGRNGVK